MMQQKFISLPASIEEDPIVIEFRKPLTKIKAIKKELSCKKSDFTKKDNNLL